MCRYTRWMHNNIHAFRRFSSMKTELSQLEYNSLCYNSGANRKSRLWKKYHWLFQLFQQPINQPSQTDASVCLYKLCAVFKFIVNLNITSNIFTFFNCIKKLTSTYYLPRGKCLPWGIRQVPNFYNELPPCEIDEESRWMRLNNIQSFAFTFLYNS